MPSVRASQWKSSLAGYDPLNIFGKQREQTLDIAAAKCCIYILHNLDVLLYDHRNPPVSLSYDKTLCRHIYWAEEQDARLLQAHVPPVRNSLPACVLLGQRNGEAEHEHALVVIAVLVTSFLAGLSARLPAPLR